jgi:hypothetical protein
MTTFSAALALGGAQWVLGQKPGITRRKTTDVDDEIKTVELDPGVSQQEIQKIPNIPIEAQQSALFSYTSGTFEPYVNDIFQAPNARGQMITLTLVRVSQYKMRPTTRLSTKKTAQPDSFSLMFRAEARLPKFTSIHRVSHPALGEIDMFLTEHQADDGTLFYEAVFNHVR